ncbi:MAG: group II intron reverse transcriptase/maturase [Desulfomonile tiedjei]|nr:group II intron reverse transcriptase/maturase [Desulfomonile tiedjei]
MTPQLLRLKLLAREAPELCFKTVHHLLKVELLELAFHRLDERKAVGTDGISKDRYAKNLQANLMDLECRIQRGGYRPLPARQVLIPKANGGTRPIAISALEDKVVQTAVGTILDALYEPLFKDISTGFRPRRGSHDAIRKVYHLLKRNYRPYVVDCDIRSFFDSMDHGKLMEFVGKRISDKRFLRLIGRLLRMGVMTPKGETQINRIGSPQGSAVSPILANIYLHYVIDTWFGETHEKYDQQMVRYADDAVFCFKDPQAAQTMLEGLKSRLKENHLELNEDKTRIVEFRREGPNRFDFLGFTFYWGKTREGARLLKAKTCAKKVRHAILEFKLWIKGCRNRYPIKTLWRKAAEKLNGHYAYYGMTVNNKLGFYYFTCVKLLCKWLNRRSQKKSFSPAAFQDRLRRIPLPKPWGCRLVDLNQGVLEYAI